MKKRSLYLDVNFRIVVAILIVTYAILFSSYFEYPLTEKQAGAFPIHHWASIIGFSAIVLFNPVYSIIKRKYPATYKTLFNLHIYINLIAFLAVSIHFGHHVVEEIDPVIDTGTGYLQYSVVTLLIATGIIRRFQLAPGQRKVWRFLHESLSLTLLIFVIGHILRAFRIM